MAEYSQLSNKELRQQLKSYGYGVGPITDANRSAYLSKLKDAVRGQPPPPPSRSRAKTSTTTSSSQSSSVEEERPSQPSISNKTKKGNAAKEEEKTAKANKLGDEASEHIARIVLNGRTNKKNEPTNELKTDRRPPNNKSSAVEKQAKTSNRGAKAEEKTVVKASQPVTRQKSSTEPSNDEDDDTDSESGGSLESNSETESDEDDGDRRAENPPSPPQRRAAAIKKLQPITNETRLKKRNGAVKDTNGNTTVAAGKSVTKNAAKDSADEMHPGPRRGARRQQQHFAESADDESYADKNEGGRFSTLQQLSGEIDQTLTASDNSVVSPDHGKVAPPVPVEKAGKSSKAGNLPVAKEKQNGKAPKENTVEPDVVANDGPRARRGIRDKKQDAGLNVGEERNPRATPSPSSDVVHSQAATTAAPSKAGGRSTRAAKAKLDFEAAGEADDNMAVAPADFTAAGANVNHESKNEGGGGDDDEDDADDISNPDEEDDVDDAAEDGTLADFASEYPGREEEFKALYNFTRTALIRSSHGCAYVSGVPGTGKTATVRQVIAALKFERRQNRRANAAPGGEKDRRLQRTQSSEQRVLGGPTQEAHSVLPDFVFIEVNGMRMLDPKQIYVRLYQGLMKAQDFEVPAKVPLKDAEKYIADVFGANTSFMNGEGGAVPQPPTLMRGGKSTVAKNKLRLAAENRRTILLVVDELDAFKTLRQEILYKLFEYSQFEHNKFVVITIANTMDLDERHVTARVASRLAMSKFQFQPYTHEQLTAICQHWLQHDLQARNGNVEIVTDGGIDAFRLAARKVANLSGDARRVVQICKRALELAEEEAEEENSGASSSLTVHHINAACEEMFKSPKFAYLRNGVTPVERLFLEAYLDIVGAPGCTRDFTKLETVYAQMIARLRLNGGGGGGVTGAGDARAGTRSRVAATKQQPKAESVMNEQLLRFNMAQKAMQSLVSFGILQESAGEGGRAAIPADSAAIQPLFFTLTMSTADARRALELVADAGGPN